MQTNGKYLIVNGDDFGISEEVNEGVIQAHQRGILTSCSLMVTGDAFEGAVRLARQNPNLAVGIHITCVDGRSVFPHSEIPHLVDWSGHFPSDPACTGVKYFFCKRARKELFREVGAQFERFQETGLDFSHIDSHCHMHVNPVAFSAALEMGEKYGVRRMRVPEDDYNTARPFLEPSRGKAGYDLMFRILARRMKVKLRGRGFRFPSRVYGNFLSGAMTREYVLSVLDHVRTGISEIYFHPALLFDHADTGKVQHLLELSILLDPDVRSRMEKLGITPATYFDLDKF
jgi:hopanoid biosynthesis associated protein HpnK